jgi:hypothetical protein
MRIIGSAKPEKFLRLQICAILFKCGLHHKSSRGHKVVTARLEMGVPRGIYAPLDRDIAQHKTASLHGINRFETGASVKPIFK